MLDEYYERYDESQRLADGDGDIERVRTQDILSRYLPPAPAVILDIGGATGVHALPLADAGYRVHLVDPVSAHVEQAANASRASRHPLASCSAGDARNLQFPDRSADAVLLLGPMYHLTSREDRLRALREARRVLRPGGKVFAAAISRFAWLIDGISRDFIADAAFVEILDRDLREGQHHNPTGDLRFFTDSYFHRADELQAEVAEAGLTIDACLGIEGPFWDASDMPGWKVPEKRQLILSLLRKVEAEPSLLGSSAHLMAIATCHDR